MTVGRIRILGAATALALLVGGGAIGTAEAAAPQVTLKQMPTMAEVAKAVPAVKGGSVTSEKTKAFEGNTGDCRPAGRRTKIKAGRLSSYWARPTREGSPSVAHVEVALFATKKQAKRVVTDYAAYVKNCAHTMPAGSEMKRQSVPRLGQQRLGFTSTWLADDELPARSISTILVRKGRALVQIYRWQKGHRVQFPHTVRLTRVALKRAT